MEKEFIPYEQTLALKELGFDEPCFGKFYYNQLEIGGVWTNNDFKEDPDVFISAPTFSQCFRFFREKHDLDVISRPHIEKSKKYVCDPVNFKLEAKNTYEKAELACLIKLIEIVGGQN